MIHRLTIPVLALASLLPLPAVAAATVTPTPATLVVVGHADVQRAPDKATINAEIITNDKNSEEARKKNDIISNRVVTAINGLGLSEKTIRTVNFRSSFVPRDKTTAPDAVTGFVTTRTIAVTIKPEAIETVTSTLNANGVTEIDGVSTDVTQRKNAYQDTLASAMNDAQLQAQVVARAAHVRLVRIVTVDATQAPVFSRHMAAMAEMKAPAPADVQLSATVNVTYEIAPGQ